MVIQSARALHRSLAPTLRQLEALRAYLNHGSQLGAASALNVSERTLKNHLAALRARLDVHTNAQAVYVLWLGYRDHTSSCDLMSHADCLPDLNELDAFR